MTSHTNSVLRDLKLLSYPARPWVKTRQTNDGRPILDVLIVGGGQSGLATAFALMRERVNNILVVDNNPPCQAGPWRTFARMPTLRTPKYLTGADLGIPSLTFQAWFESEHGEEAFSNLTFIPTDEWAKYLDWYRDTLQIPFWPQTRVRHIVWNEEDDCFSVSYMQAQHEDTVFTRKIVLATGIDGCGQWDIPAIVLDNLPKQLYAHTREDIDFEQLAGKSIACLGAGASAFDNASMALKHSCRDVHLYFRRNQLPDINPYRWAEFAGFLNHHSDLKDLDKWRFIKQIVDMGQLPPHDTYQRAKSHPNFSLHPSSPWLSVRHENDQAVISTPQGTFRHDFVIVATGFKTDLSTRPELSAIEAHIARWRDRFEPDDCHHDLLEHPYLGPNLEFQERVPASSPWISSVFCYTFGGLLSHGFSGGSISGMKYSLPKLVSGITRQLYRDDLDEHYQALRTFDLKEF